jgi:hypothetical protein
MEMAGLDIHKANVLGGIMSLLVMVLCILIFVFRLNNMPVVERWLGILFMAMAFPFGYLLLGARGLHRPPLYFLQMGTILAFIFLELFLDYIFQFDFRRVKWMTLVYVMFFFAGTGGLIGVASLAGKPWMYAAIALFLLMTGLAFWQRAKTGM